MAPKAQNSSTNKKKPWMHHHPELGGIVLLAFVASQLLSLVTYNSSTSSANLLGLIGHACAWFWYASFGLTSFVMLLFCGWISLKMIFSTLEEGYSKKIFAATLAFFSISMILTLIGSLFPNIETFFAKLVGMAPQFRLGLSKEIQFRLGGLPYHYIFHSLPYCNLEKLLNYAGTFLVFSSLLIISVAYIYNITFQKCISWMKASFHAFLERRHERKLARMRAKDLKGDLVHPFREKKQVVSASVDSESGQKGAQTTFRGAGDTITRKIELPPTFNNIPSSLVSKTQEPLDLLCELPKPQLATPPATQPPKANSVRQTPQQKLINTAPQIVSFKDYQMPSMDYLNNPKKSDPSLLKNELKQKADLLEETLMSFGIEAKVGQIHCGPTITSFEVHPAVGVKIGKIKTLENDIALNMEAKSIRIIAPIPGKAAVGIEVPNHYPQEVSFKEILATYQKQGSHFRIPMLLGKGVNGDLVIADLAKLPHCIIAGATGSGKSVCINSIVISILMMCRPDEVRLLMIDPKKVELTPYTELPHMLAPVITEPQAACVALNWLVKEMEKRYEILRLTGQRNIDSFNRRKIEETEKSFPIDIPEKLPYYVAIIDELADLMMVASQDIETPIARIAQMARAVGIHLILATQRPSREVITGLIKANFPSRIAFKVASRVNSQIILDDVGAETLLGNGDMLFLMPGASQLVRAQGVYVRDEEINKVIEHILKQAPKQYVITSFEQLQLQEFADSQQKDDAPQDSLYDEAKNIVFSTGNASTTFLQRKLKIGYARAASLMDLLEANGIVGPQEGAKPRKINFPRSQEQAMQAGPEDFENALEDLD